MRSRNDPQANGAVRGLATPAILLALASIDPAPYAAIGELRHLMSLTLNARLARVFRIVHRKNVPWILENGLHARTSPRKDPGYVAIGNADLIEKRRHRTVLIPPGGTLADYVPFYFTPHSPMLYNS
jgi:hypothetical protein